MNNDPKIVRRNNIFWIQIIFSIIWPAILCSSWKTIEGNFGIIPVYFLWFVVPGIINTCFCYKLNKQRSFLVLINGIILLPLVLYIIWGMSIHPHTRDPFSGILILYFSGYLVYIYHVLLSEKIDIREDLRFLKIMKFLKVMRYYIPICFLFIGLILFVILFIIKGFSLGLY